jgi:preprotein translocase subunit SecF
MRIGQFLELWQCVLYLMISYRKWQYSLGAIAAVAHDVIFVLGIYSLCYKFAPFEWRLISTLLLRFLL